MVVRVDLGRMAEELKKISGGTIEQQKAAIVLGLYMSIRMLVERSPVDTGLYAQSWNVSHDEHKAVIGNTAPHAAVIELGARPFTPPLAPLLAWAKRVLKDPSQPPDYSPAVWGLARGTQRKIAEQGMEPRHILTKAIPQILANIEAEFRSMR